MKNSQIASLQNKNSKKNEIDIKRNTINPISRFLEAEWVKSSFKHDFIPVTDLAKKYDEFCDSDKISELVKLNIVGSNELIEFGAEFVPNFITPFIKGISLTKISGLKNSFNKSSKAYLEDIVRNPKSINSKSMRFLKANIFKFLNFVIREEGLLTNLFFVIVHLIFIVGVPLLMFMAITWSLIQIGQVNQDIDTYVFRLNDMYNSSSYNFWFDHLTAKAYFFVIFSLWLFFIVTGLMELIWYYATGAKDTGKYIVTRTWPRFVISISFWIIIIIFILLENMIFLSATIEAEQILT